MFRIINKLALLCLILSLFGCYNLVKNESEDGQHNTASNKPNNHGGNTNTTTNVNTGSPNRGGQIFAVIYANKDRIIAKQKSGEPFPGQMFKSSFNSQNASELKAARKNIQEELNQYYGTMCQQVANSPCTIDPIADRDFALGRVEIFNCSQCQGSNASGGLPNVYHIAPWDDAVEVATNTGNQYIGKYDAETHTIFEQIQQSPDTIELLRNKGYRWGI